jgi:hypothetical protein
LRVVVNSDRIIAALIKDSKSREIILSGKFELVTIDFAVSEIREHEEEEILQKAHLPKSQFESVLSILLSRIFLTNDLVVRGKMKEAKIIMDQIDPGDTPFIALALAIAAPVYIGVAVLVGAEGHGLSAAGIAAADHVVSIPMAPGVDSLNVATAAAIAFYELTRVHPPANRN